VKDRFILFWVGESMRVVVVDVSPASPTATLQTWTHQRRLRSVAKESTPPSATAVVLVAVLVTLSLRPEPQARPTPTRCFVVSKHSIRRSL
jgi:hypothetical protein